MSIISDTIHYFKGLGRFRDVVVSPNGLKIYLACDSSGQTSGPTGGSTTVPANPGSILEFTYQPPEGMRSSNPLITKNKIIEAVKDRTVDVYPNPANAFIIVYSYRDIMSRTILFDLNGKMITRQKATGLSSRIETGNFPNGLYVLKVSDEKGRVLRVEKLIIHK